MVSVCFSLQVILDLSGLDWSEADPLGDDPENQDEVQAGELLAALAEALDLAPAVRAMVAKLAVAAKPAFRVILATNESALLNDN